jgi:hypothetical protein
VLSIREAAASHTRAQQAYRVPGICPGALSWSSPQAGDPYLRNQLTSHHLSRGQGTFAGWLDHAYVTAKGVGQVLAIGQGPRAEEGLPPWQRGDCRSHMCPIPNPTRAEYQSAGPGASPAGWGIPSWAEKSVCVCVCVLRVASGETVLQWGQDWGAPGS